MLLSTVTSLVGKAGEAAKRTGPRSSNNKAPHSFIWASKLLLRPGLFLTIVICAKF